MFWSLGFTWISFWSLFFGRPISRGGIRLYIFFVASSHISNKIRRLISVIQSNSFLDVSCPQREELDVWALESLVFRSFVCNMRIHPRRKARKSFNSNSVMRTFNPASKETMWTLQRAFDCTLFWSVQWEYTRTFSIGSSHMCQRPVLQTCQYGGGHNLKYIQKKFRHGPV